MKPDSRLQVLRSQCSSCPASDRAFLRILSEVIDVMSLLNAMIPTVISSGRMKDPLPPQAPWNAPHATGQLKLLEAFVSMLILFQQAIDPIYPGDMRERESLSGHVCNLWPMLSPTGMESQTLTHLMIEMKTLF